MGRGPFVVPAGSSSIPFLVYTISFSSTSKLLEDSSQKAERAITSHPPFPTFLKQLHGFQLILSQAFILNDHLFSDIIFHIIDVSNVLSLFVVQSEMERAGQEDISALFGSEPSF